MDFSSIAGRALARDWASPERKILTLESFSLTEEDGGLDLQAAARCVSDPTLKRSLELHAADELRHAALFRARASELRRLARTELAAESETLRTHDLARTPLRTASPMDAHGSLLAGLCDELGEVAYVALLHVAERRAAALFERHRAALASDPETSAIFTEILVDEKFHVAYTGHVLERWRKEGRAAEVKAALSRARGSRFVAAWKRFGARTAGSFGRLVLMILYWTLLLPFALVARRRRAATGWQVTHSGEPAQLLRSQYR